jgi:hypothetical protein
VHDRVLLHHGGSTSGLVEVVVVAVLPMLAPAGTWYTLRLPDGSTLSAPAREVVGWNLS